MLFSLAFLNRFRQRFSALGSIENPRTSLDDPDAWLLDALGMKTDAGVRVTAKIALSQPAFWKGVNLIAGDIGKMGLFVHRTDDNGGRERDRNHPAYRLLRRAPNGAMTAAVFLETLMFHSLIRGNGYGWIRRDGAGRPLSIVILSSTNTKPVFIDDELWYVTKIKNKPWKIPATDVVHVKGLTEDGINGISVIDVMANALGLGVAARQFGSSFLARGAQASGVLQIDHRMSPKSLVNAAAAFKKQIEGLEKVGGVAVVPPGMKYQQLTISPEQSQLLATRQFETVEVSNILLIPPHKLGDSSKAAYNSLEAENQSYIDQCLDRWLVRIEDECNMKLLSEEEQLNESHRVEFNRNSLMRTDLASRMASYRIGMEIGLYTVNEIKRKESEATVGPFGDVRYTPANWLPVGKSGASPAPEPEPKEPEPAPEPAESAEGARRRAAAGPDLHALTTHRDLVRDRIDRMLAVEQKQVQTAAEKETNFVAWLDEFYPEHERKLYECLLPAVRATWAVLLREKPEGALEAFCREYVEKSRADLLNAANATADRFPKLVEATLDGWRRSRADVETDSLMQLEAYHAAA